MAEFNIAIEHMGSTSVEGFPTKPIVDIDIILRSNLQLKSTSERLNRLGYEPKGDQGIAGRFAFRQTSAAVPRVGSGITWQAHHLYVCYPDSLALKNHIAFRYALQTNEKLKNQYAELKWLLLEDLDINRTQYNSLKTDFILYVLRDAGFSEHELLQIKAANI